MASDSTGWPLFEERRPLARAKRRAQRRGSRSPWVLATLAFVCGGLISAAVFTIGWRHQAQRNTAAETALAAATAHVHALEIRRRALEGSLASARRAERRDRQAAAAARASAAAVVRSANALAGEASTARGSADPVTSDAGALRSSASRIASELKTLTAYLTTTPPRQLDPGYIASQTAYLAQQLSELESKSGNLGDAVSSFQAALRKLSADLAALSLSR
jgi:hypothetical protein